MFNFSWKQYVTSHMASIIYINSDFLTVNSKELPLRRDQVHDCVQNVSRTVIILFWVFHIGLVHENGEFVTMSWSPLPPS